MTKLLNNKMNKSRAKRVGSINNTPTHP